MTGAVSEFRVSVDEIGHAEGFSHLSSECKAYLLRTATSRELMLIADGALDQDPPNLTYIVGLGGIAKLRAGQAGENPDFTDAHAYIESLQREAEAVVVPMDDINDIK